MNKYDMNENEEIEFNEKERDMIIQTTVYDSENEIGRKLVANGWISYHWVPEIFEVVKIFTWALPDNGEDDDNYDFEIMGSMNKIHDLVMEGTK